MPNGRWARHLRWCAILIVLAARAAASATLVPDTTLAPELFAFPGATTAPPSGASAGFALADLWLGDEPFGNPASSPPRTAMLAPTFLRVSRQDLRAHTSTFEENSGFFDAAGGRVSWPVRSVGITLYAWQPVIRREEEAYTGTFRGRAGVYRTSSTSRETRAGLAVSLPVSQVRVGVAGEWTQRDDSYEYTDQNGSPGQGLHHEDFRGGALGFRAGIQAALQARVEIGAGVGYLPALDLTGESRYQPASALVASNVSSFSMRRDAGWEGGLGARVGITPAFRVLGSLSGRSAQDWHGGGLDAARDIASEFTGSPGAGFGWSVAFDLHDPQDPWTARLGIGQEQQRGVPEPRVGVVGLGLGYDFEGVRVDVAGVRRSIQRPAKATSYDDRVVASATAAF